MSGNPRSGSHRTVQGRNGPASGRVARANWREGAMPREMGPALRLTPLSPACGLRRALYARRFNTARKRCLHRPALAPVPVPPEAGYDPKTCPMPSGGSETFALIRTSSGSALPESIASPSVPDRKLRSPDCGALRLHRSGTDPPEGVSVLIPPPRGCHRRVDPVLKPPGSLGLGGLRSGSLCRLDVWKMRRATDSGNGGTGQLSTFARIASGQGWITQLLAATRRNYRWSRCARSRKRSALSLMKPAASCWS
jgi:hypothetical protein